MKKNILSVTADLTHCLIAISREDEIFEKNIEANSTKYLVSSIQEMLNEFSIQPSEIEGVITASGPGSFTGIRAAQSFTKGFAFALQIPSVSVSYFDVIDFEANRRFGALDFPKLIVIKSEKQQIYYDLRIAAGKSISGVSKKDISEIIGDINQLKVIGEGVDEIICDDNFRKFSVTDFRSAKYLLNFSDRLSESSKLETLYINASITSSLKIPEQKRQ